jgi:hypothetical protein
VVQAGPVCEQAEKWGGGPLEQKMIFSFLFPREISNKFYLQF